MSGGEHDDDEALRNCPTCGSHLHHLIPAETILRYLLSEDCPDEGVAAALNGDAAFWREVAREWLRQLDDARATLVRRMDRRRKARPG